MGRPVSAHPNIVSQACIEINFGVGKLLHVLSHTVFGCLFIFIYLQNLLSVQNRTAVYVLEFTM